MLILNSYSAVNFGRALFPIFALALNLPEDFFDDKVKWASSAFSNPSIDRNWKLTADKTLRRIDEIFALSSTNRTNR